MNEIQYLQFIHDHLINVHGEHADGQMMTEFRSVIEKVTEIKHELGIMKNNT